MKIPLILLTLTLSTPLLADYKIQFTQSNINVPEKTGPTGTLHENGVTVQCLGMEDGTEFSLNGKTYRVVYSQADARTYAANACTSNMTNFSNLFERFEEFNEDISHWDTAQVTTFSDLFFYAYKFNQDISHWNVSNVRNMGDSFRYANRFNQDLSSWCFPYISSPPSLYSAGATDWTLPKPRFGSC